jgi:hypothetical protein
MPCLFVLVAGFLPRLGSILLWIARPAYFSAAFGGSWFWPLLGIIVLPFTTLMYVLLWSPIGLTGWDWLWLILAVMIDIAHYGSTAYNNRNQMPGYSQYAPATQPSAPAASAAVTSAPVAAATTASMMTSTPAAVEPLPAVPFTPAATPPVVTDVPASPPADTGNEGN